MATARKLIYDGLREGNIIPANAALSATDVQNTELLPLLNNYLFELVGEVIGEEPRDWSVPPRVVSDTTPYWNKDPRQLDVEQQPGSSTFGAGYAYQHPPANSRLVIAATVADIVYLPPAPDDGALVSIVDLNSSAVVTLHANGRFINDTASIDLDPVSSYHGAMFMYRGDRGSWLPLTEMAVDDNSPLPTVFDDVLAIGLYYAAASRYGSTPSASTNMRYAKKLAKLKKRYRQKQPIIAPDSHPAESIQEYTGIFITQR